MKSPRHQLIKALVETMSCVTRTVTSAKNIPFHGCTLSQSEARVMMYIAQSPEGSMSVKELAQTLRVTSGAITQTIDGLVENNLVTRRESKSDRRVLDIALTKKAHEEFAAFQKKYFTGIAPVFEVLSDAEIEQLTRLLSKVSLAQRGGEINHE